jgi:hypothetical protein
MEAEAFLAAMKDLKLHRQKRDLAARRYVCVWADGVYLQARMEDNAECMLVLIGATPEGKKELVGFQVGARESAQSWRELAGYDALCRRSELVALRVEDLSELESGAMSILVRRAKNDPFGDGRLGYLTPGTVTLLKEDVYYGTGQAILEKRQRIKLKTIQQRRALHQNSKAA